MKVNTIKFNLLRNKAIWLIGIAVPVLLLMVLCIYQIGWERIDVTQISTQQQEEILSAYNLNTDGQEKVEEFFRVSYTTDVYFVIRLSGISDVKQWCENNSLWEKEEFSNLPMVFHNQRYAQQRIYIDSDAVYVSCLYENIPAVGELFFELYDRQQ